jgi:hypothetical protein
MRIVAVKIDKELRVSVAWMQESGGGRLVKRQTRGDLCSEAFAEAMASTVAPALDSLGIADNGGACFRGLTLTEKRGVVEEGVGKRGRPQYRTVTADAFVVTMQRNGTATVGVVKTDKLGMAELTNRSGDVTLGKAPYVLCRAVEVLIAAAKAHVKASMEAPALG